MVIWALAGLALAGSARWLAPPDFRDDYLRLLSILFPWAALWASLTVHAPLPSSLRRVHHVTVGSILTLLLVACAARCAGDTGRLGPLATRLYLLTGMAAGLFAVFGTAWSVLASTSWRRTRKAGVLGDPRLVG